MPGDNVIVAGPGLHRGRQGTIIDVTSHSGDFVYRYRVGFSDGEDDLFFWFELAKLEF